MLFFPVTALELKEKWQLLVSEAFSLPVTTTTLSHRYKFIITGGIHLKRWSKDQYSNHYSQDCLFPAPLPCLPACLQITVIFLPPSGPLQESCSLQTIGKLWLPITLKLLWHKTVLALTFLLYSYPVCLCTHYYLFCAQMFISLLEMFILRVNIDIHCEKIEI